MIPVIPGILFAGDRITHACQRLQQQNDSDQTTSYRQWTKELSVKPACERMKIINRVVRRRYQAGASLSSTPLALAAYRDHFSKQCTNSFDIPGYAPADVDEHVEPSGLDFMNSVLL